MIGDGLDRGLHVAALDRIVEPAVLEVADQAYQLQNGAALLVAEVRQPAGCNSDEVEINPKQTEQLISDPEKLQ